MSTFNPLMRDMQDLRVQCENRYNEVSHWFLSEMEKINVMQSRFAADPSVVFYGDSRSSFVDAVEFMDELSALSAVLMAFPVAGTGHDDLNEARELREMLSVGLHSRLASNKVKSTEYERTIASVLTCLSTYIVVKKNL